MSIWRTARLGDEIDLLYGKSLPASARVAGHVPVFGSNGRVGAHNVAAVSGPGIVVGRKGSVGELAFSREPFWPIDTTYYVNNRGQHDWRFLYHLLSTLGLSKLNSHSAVPGLNRDDVYSIEVAFPSRADEPRIAAALDEIDAAIAGESKALEVSRALKRAAMRELFTRGLRGEAQKETDFDPAPESWEIEALDRCAIVQTGVAKGRKFSDTDLVDVPYLRVANVQDGYLDLSEIKSIQIRRSELDRFSLRPGDVVLTEGGDFDKLGRGFIWRGEVPQCVHQNHIFAVRPNIARLLPEFFAYLAQSHYGKAYFLMVAHKTTNLASINTTKLKAFPVLIPSIDEQREIVAILDAIDRKIALHKEKRAVLEKLFKSLLHKVMTGEVRVADLNLDALGRAASPASGGGKCAAGMRGAP